MLVPMARYLAYPNPFSLVMSLQTAFVLQPHHYTIMPLPNCVSAVLVYGKIILKRGKSDPPLDTCGSILLLFIQGHLKHTQFAPPPLHFG